MGRKTQAERRATSQRRLLEAAASLVAEQGIAQTTLAEIGKKAGYSRGLVTERFGSKAGLVRALTREIQQHFARDLLAPALKGRPGFGGVLVAVDTFLERLARGSVEGRAFYALLGESIALVPEIRDVFAELDRASRDGFEQLVTDAVRAGELRADLGVPAFAALLFGTLRGIALQHVIDPGALDLNAVRKELHRSLERALQTDEDP